MSVLRAAPAIALLLFGVSPSSAGSPRQYEDYHKSAYLPYINAPGPLEDITEVPRLRISFGTRSYGVVMDTGSTGVVVSADKIPNIRGLQSLGPGKLTYSSSGRIMMGQWVVTPMTIIGGDGTRVTTAPMPVLAVTQVQCMEGARRCTPNEAPHQISMMGIGFGRRHDRQAQSGPDTNPFLNTAKLGEGGPNVERMRRGYIVTRRGIHMDLGQHAGRFRLYQACAGGGRQRLGGHPCLHLGEWRKACRLWQPFDGYRRDRHVPHRAQQPSFGHPCHGNGTRDHAGNGNESHDLDS
jgi:hypothetical protein